MTLAERVKEAPALKGQNVLIIDIERTKGSATVEFWDLGDFKNRRIHADDVTEWPRTICAAWRWYGEKRIHFASEWGDGRADMLQATWDAYDRANIVVGHNLDRFDTKKLKGEWNLEGLLPPSPFKTVDTLKVARTEFGYESNTLDALLTRAGLQGKTDRYDVKVAQAALAGDKAAQRQITAYNKGDIDATQRLYDSLRPWIRNHPHNVVGTANDRPTCTSCWGDNLERNGVTLARQITYVAWRCMDCGANVKGTRHSRAAITSGVAI